MNALTLVCKPILLLWENAIIDPLLTDHTPLSFMITDPIHSAHSKASNKKAAIEMPDFTKLGDDIMGALKKSPIGKLFVQN